MKRHRSGESGFTVVEILVVLIMAGILLAIGMPSFLSQKQVMRKTIGSTLTLLKTANLSARANSGNPYRITLRSEGTEQYFEVETEVAGTCATTRNLTDPPTWRQDPSKRLYLPSTIEASGLSPGTATVVGTNINVNNGICFDGRGQTIGGGNTFTLTDREFESLGNGGSKARTATFNISAVGDVSVVVKDASGTLVDQY
jgi:type II secretory pathway pseudopilin PulG